LEGCYTFNSLLLAGNEPEEGRDGSGLPDDG